MDLDTLRREFASPSTVYRMAVLLRINDETDESQLRWQVRQIREKGFGGVFAYYEDLDGAAPAPFLSEWWWGVIRWLSEACSDEGLQFWVYDEADWPSGIAGGAVLEGHPEREWAYIEAQEETLEPGAKPTLPIEPGRFLGAAAYRTRDGCVDADSITEISEKAGEEGVGWTPQESGWTVAAYHWTTRKGYHGRPFSDLMSQEVGQAFVDAVYKPHVDHASATRGRVAGFFTDEPCLTLSMAPGAEFMPAPALPWSDALPSAFNELTGAGLTQSLPLLHHPGSAEGLRLLDAFWRACAELFITNYFGAIRRFCDDNGLAASGHLMGEEHFGHHLSENGAAVPAILRQFDVPGVDWILPRGNAVPSTTLKYAASAAHLMGRERSWCESFAGSGWDLSFPEMLRVLNHEHVHGISMQVFICYKHSLRGPHRAMAYNPGVSYQQPFWDHFRPVADYAARLAAVTAGTGHVADVLLLYPDADIRANTWNAETLARRSQEFNRLGDAIREAGFDYDVHDAAALVEHGEMKDGRLALGDESFSVLVVPPVDVLTRETAKRLADYAGQGLRVAYSGEPPRHSPEGGWDDDELTQTVSRLVDGGTKDQWRAVGQGAAAVLSGPGALPALLGEAAPPDVRCQEGGVVGCHRRLSKGGDLYLLMNTRDEARETELRLRATGRAYHWDLFSGEERAMEAPQCDGECTTVRLGFEAHGARAVLLIDEEAPASAPQEKRPATRERAVDVDGPFAFWAEETLNRREIAWNFSCDHAAFTPKPGEFDPPREMPLGDWREHGLPYFSGLGHYRTLVYLGDLPEGAAVRLELGRVAASAQVVLNGQHAGHAFAPPYALDVTERVRSGENEMEVIVANTLANYYAQARELDQAERWQGGVKGADLASGLFGPVRFVIRSEKPTKGRASK